LHILFIDESGTPPKPNDSTPPYFVIGGIIIPENYWHKVKDDIFGLKVRHKIRGEIKWRYFAPNNTDKGNPLKKPRLRAKKCYKNRNI
jgi:hypothetical protein